MTEEEKKEIAVGRWELFQQRRYVSNSLKFRLYGIVGPVMSKYFNFKMESCTELTGDQMLFQTNLMIALIESGEFKDD